MGINQEKKKLCWNCEGSVSRTLETCPFCGVYLNPEESPGDSFEENRDRLEVPKAPYMPQENVAASEADRSTEAGSVSSIYALLLLLSGSVYALFGLVVLLFSQNGVFALSWSQEWSYVFLAIAMPLLIVGVIQLRRLDS